MERKKLLSEKKFVDSVKVYKELNVKVSESPESTPEGEYFAPIVFSLSSISRFSSSVVTILPCFVWVRFLLPSSPSRSVPSLWYGFRTWSTVEWYSLTFIFECLFLKWWYMCNTSLPQWGNRQVTHDLFERDRLRDWRSFIALLTPLWYLDRWLSSRFRLFPICGHPRMRHMPLFR